MELEHLEIVKEPLRPRFNIGKKNKKNGRQSISFSDNTVLELAQYKNIIKTKMLKITSSHIPNLMLGLV